VSALTADHAKQREQFGRPLARFQAVAHAVARQAALAAMARTTVSAAVERRNAGPGPALAARVACAQAATEVSQIAHQIHGAIGVTRESPLHRFTLRMREWRDAYGPARSWDALLGRWVIRQPDYLWELSLPEHSRELDDGGRG
jgi:acyl-CoA dehydrogenase